ncbi:prephenate dehydrogenase/arogenate dehydrogenase family protein [Alphaproteobacteria bacterium]|nr:prephenate dehydrogenase/arogenate dehydrogenase family protein [Alphaproteobacteria bacterium]
MFSNILIIGFGLIGSSIAKGVQKNSLSKKITVFDTDKTVKKRILSSNFKHVHYVAKIESAISNADLIIICIPVLGYEKIFKNIAKYGNPDLIVTDVGSTKSNMIKIFNKNFKSKFSYVPSHPIAGTEKSGLENGFAELFHNRYNIICPTNNKKTKDVMIIKKFWENLGMHVDILSAKDHDKILGLTSHLPHLIAYSLVRTAMKKEKLMKSNIIKYSAGGFRDFTRITENNPNMWRDTFIANEKIINDFCKSFISEIKQFGLEIKQKKLSKLHSKLDETRKIRKKIIKARMAGKFIPND